MPIEQNFEPLDFPHFVEETKNRIRTLPEDEVKAGFIRLTNERGNHPIYPELKAVYDARFPT